MNIKTETFFCRTLRYIRIPNKKHVRKKSETTEHVRKHPHDMSACTRDARLTD